ncbi:protoheme IX farnesyltransferase, mitochondrial-like [Saccoglossus kowalevskii]|uniref:Protoheme IX farnesyltransferase, mitochondrial n=1 Tax=Saccoglossus kowalevskii TaxID=10224 RepID=A0ABM0GPS0_SACKO|nr:PREDICTED: protoheme IX farnesyltransferase, mitochondrial-like [Saccoglossus kowalevskii]
MAAARHLCSLCGGPPLTSHAGYRVLTSIWCTGQHETGVYRNTKFRPYHSGFVGTASMARKLTNFYTYKCKGPIVEHRIRSSLFVTRQITSKTTTVYGEAKPNVEPISQTSVTNTDKNTPVNLSDTLPSNKTSALNTALVNNISKISPCPLEPEDGNKDVFTLDKSWTEQKLDFSKLPYYYMQLGKSRLTALVVLTAAGGYVMAPGDFYIGTLLFTTLGTFLTSSSANAINQFIEVPYDSQMARTRNRVLVQQLISPLHAATFAAVSGIAGTAILALGCNPLTAVLGLGNLALYTMVYTPMKRVSILNTWVGAVVGGVPPLMGWAACMGHLDPGAWLLAGFLYAWQFPHFNSLSWNLRGEYSRGGYRMMATTNPALCRRVALRYSFGIIALSTLAPVVNLTTWAFAVDSLPINLYMSWLAWRFYKNKDSESARRLFRFSLLHLPLLMLLLLISKKKLYEKNIDAKSKTV